jgi:two-component system nitrogen regulation response regulator GlnG
MCCQGSVLAADDVAQRIESATGSSGKSDDQAIIDWRLFIDQRLAVDDERLYRAAMEAMDQRLLKLVLQRMDGNQARAAKALGMTRSRLRQKLRDSGIVIDRQIDVRRCIKSQIPPTAVE